MTVLYPLINAVWFEQADEGNPGAFTDFYVKNVTFKNTFIDCKNGYRIDSGVDANDRFYAADRPAAIRLQSVTNITFDGLTIVNAEDAFRVANYRTTQMNITIT